MRKASTVQRFKLVALAIFAAGTLAFLFTENAANRTAHAYSAGPPAGYTRAPGEEPESCAECHLFEQAGSGRIEIDAPRNYVPGESYLVSVRHTNPDATRKRWGFELTALDESEQRAGTFEPLDNLTQALTGQGPFPERQYIEHTSAGTFFGQTGGASWTFRWTAPSSDAGVVTFYAAGNHANGDQNTSGDNIYFTFTTSSPTAPAPDFDVTVTPTSRIVTPGGSTTYAVAVTPSAGFTGAVTLSAAGLPAGAQAAFDPPTLNVNDANSQTSTLTVQTSAATPLGSYQLNVNAAAGTLQHAAQATLVVAAPTSADLSVSMSDSPDPVPVRSNLSYRITVTNNGPAAATGVTLSDGLPAGANFVSATPSQGACSGTTNVTCSLGTIAQGASAVVILVVQPQNVGQLSNSASAAANEGDPVPSNNGAVTTTAVEQQGSSPRMLAPNLDVRTVVTGLDQPTGIAFLGAGDFLALEKATGKVKRVVGGAVEGTVLDLPVNSASERGLLGVALHPAFSSNGFVYLYWTESPTGADSTDTATVFLLGNRVDRYVWNGSGLVFDRNLIKLRAHQEDEGQPLRGNHNGGRLSFGPDGKLYILVGDVGRRGFMQNVTSPVGPAGKDDPWGGPEPDDGHLTGVVLRLNDDGTTPPDNPFFNAATGLTAPTAADNVKKVFAYGVRNGFGMAFDPIGGHLWTQENGDDAFDEINRVGAGFNGGWIQAMGPLARIGEYKAIETERAGGLQQIRWPPSLIADTPAEALQRLYQLPGSAYTDPQFSWKYAVAPSPLGFVAGQGLGPQYAGDMFVGASRTTLLGGYLFRFRLTGDRLHFLHTDPRLSDGVADNLDKFDVAESESLVAGRDFGITTDIKTGPDGRLYVVSLSNGAVYQVFARKELFVANLDGAQEVPPNSSPAAGTATITLDTDGSTARVSLNFANLTSPQTDAHIHGPAAPGTSAAPLFDLPDGGFADFQITLTPQHVRDLRAGLLYVNVHSQNFPAGEIRGQFGATTAASVVQTGAASLTVSEGVESVTVNVVRLGDTTEPAAVDYATADGQASERSDYTPARGTLNFAPGETTKSVKILLTDDAFVEGSETLTLVLTNATGGFALGPRTSTSVTITDNDASAGPNPLDGAQFFVRQHYHDFLNREPDQSGLDFWTNQVTNCGNPDLLVCRVNVSAAFFLSGEFQETGYLVYKTYGAAFGTRRVGSTVPLTLEEFLPDTQEVSRGVVIGQTGAEALLEANKVAYFERFIQRPQFLSAYPQSMSPAAFVTQLNQNAGDPLNASEAATLASQLAAGTLTRAQVLRAVAENAAFSAAEKNRAFVLMEYFGYLRRNPYDTPEPTLDFAGYNFWLGKLNNHGGNYISAEMVKAFITSGEYRARFGAP